MGLDSFVAVPMDTAGPDVLAAAFPEAVPQSFAPIPAALPAGSPVEKPLSFDDSTDWAQQDSFAVPSRPLGAEFSVQKPTSAASGDLTGPLGLGAAIADGLIVHPSSPAPESPAILGNPVDNAGNSLVAARAIGTLTGSQTFSDWVGSTDRNDFYRFDLSQASSVQLTLNGLSADADLALLSGGGGVLASSTNGGSTADVISGSLQAGQYVVRVYRFSGDTTYNLTLTATPSASPDQAGNSLETARAIGTLTGSQTFSDWVGRSDPDDYYRFDLTQASTVALTLNGLSADADLELLNGGGGVLARSTNSGSRAEAIGQSLAAGAYALRVYRFSGNTTYNLTLSATPTDNAGNSPATARAIGALTGRQTVTDWVGSTDSDDYYRLELAQPSSVDFQLQGLGANADLELLDSGGGLLASSTNGDSATEAISQSLATGQYLLRVLRVSGETPYDLTLSATPTDNAGNTLAAARAIGALTGSQTFADWVGSADSDDYYRFDLSEPRNLTLLLNGLGANADAELLNSEGTVLASSSNGGSLAESIISPLDVGAYYVRVYPFAGSTSYNLTLSVTMQGDWFDQNLNDLGLIGLGRTLSQDGNLSRVDMINILHDAKDGDQIDVTELTDLRTILDNFSRFTMADHVKVLANKVVNGDPANPRSGFGNLFAGSSASQMDHLVGKWFLGNDRPDLTSTSYRYTYANGSLVQAGISADDIDQNALGDCYYLATLSSIALEQPSHIENMFIDNGDDTFTVRFFNQGVSDYVTVDRYLPTNSSGYAVYAGWGGAPASDTSNELWVALAEKAYAQLAESGWSRLSSGTQVNAYAAISGGWMSDVIRQVTGLGATTAIVSAMIQTQLIDLVSSNKILTAGFVYGAGFGVVNGHAYTVTAYNSNNQTFHLRNPWGSSHADVTWDQLLSLRAIFIWSNA
ncbi:MAG: pre-peptidase C-terminal domain-containing protein [Cyanobacteriota bacterium]